MDLGNLTIAEIFRGLNEGDYVYDAVEENLRRLMIEEKPDAVLPVRACDRDLITESSDAVLSTRASEGDLLTDGSNPSHQPLETLCQEELAKEETLDQNLDDKSKDDGDQEVFDYNHYGKNNDDELKAMAQAAFVVSTDPEGIGHDGIIDDKSDYMPEYYDNFPEERPHLTVLHESNATEEGP
ncbi:unnamed protein product [Haemonchus placei]|uniref:Midasin n=1 Tax=Haemonchus placei TaxID=6290 RepID=A0A158QQU9_HAEPC|nr:unnamed protein product [Haemonchus placei]